MYNPGDLFSCRNPDTLAEGQAGVEGARAGARVAEYWEVAVMAEGWAVVVKETGVRERVTTEVGGAPGVARVAIKQVAAAVATVAPAVSRTYAKLCNDVRKPNRCVDLSICPCGKSSISFSPCGLATLFPRWRHFSRWSCSCHRLANTSPRPS